MKKFIEITNRGLLIAVVALTASISLLAQTVPPEKSPRPPVPAPFPKGKVDPNPPWPAAIKGEVSEKSIKVDPNVNVWLPCVSRGSVKITGWNRDEVRVFVDGGNTFNFTVQEKNPRSGEPVWIKVSGVQPKGRIGPVSECIWGEDIEIDVPVNASFNLKGSEITARIDSVGKAEIKVVGGNISLRNIANGIGAYSGQGDITVESSQGSISLESTTGNILVFEAGPSEIADWFKARTNGGAISLQGLNHRQIEVNSISGSVSFSGNIRTGGSYNLRTSRGSIRMAIPAAASSRISATYGYGTFRSEIPIDIATENVSPGPIKTIVGTFGKGGDAIIRLASNNGSIAITKKEP
ncbi:hypothetical protein BH20ACI2_BH20ACI2_27430 [soil metagenome]